MAVMSHPSASVVFRNHVALARLLRLCLGPPTARFTTQFTLPSNRGSPASSRRPKGGSYPAWSRSSSPKPSTHARKHTRAHPYASFVLAPANIVAACRYACCPDAALLLHGTAAASICPPSSRTAFTADPLLISFLSRAQGIYRSQLHRHLSKYSEVSPRDPPWSTLVTIPPSRCIQYTSPTGAHHHLLNFSSGATHR